MPWVEEECGQAQLGDAGLILRLVSVQVSENIHQA